MVIYMENHSFDSLLGYWCDDNLGRCPAGGMPTSVRLSNGAVVTPSTAPDVVPTPQGPRVPMVIVSPWARSGYTDSTHTTFAGVLAFTEATFGLRWLSANDAGAYGYSGAFNFSQSPLPAVRMRRRPVPKGEHIRWSQAKQDT